MTVEVLRNVMRLTVKLLTRSSIERVTSIRFPAAITSSTNTSNPSVRMTACPPAEKALERLGKPSS